MLFESSISDFDRKVIVHAGKDEEKEIPLGMMTNSKEIEIKVMGSRVEINENN